jgi:hypothetical protein
MYTLLHVTGFGTYFVALAPFLDFTLPREQQTELNNVRPQTLEV